MARRYYSAIAPATTLVNSINNAVTSLVVANRTGYPTSFPFTIVVGNGTLSEEVMLVTAGGGTTLTVTRSYDDTTAIAHAAGEAVIHAAAALDFREANLHINTAKTWQNLFDGTP